MFRSASPRARASAIHAVAVGLSILGARGASAQVVNVTIDPNADRKPISPYVYGVNFGTASGMTRLKYPIRRWGGNWTTRYSWFHDTRNSASDWFYFNYTNENPDPSNLPDDSSADHFFDEARAVGAEPLLCVPTIGWTPIDRVKRWGFSVAKYGPQQWTECTLTGFPFWCEPDAGNGLHPDGTPITGNDPTDTSRVVGPSFVTDWMGHIASRVGTASQNGLRLFALDNEPMLWNSTHRDVHPQPLTYDQLWAMTVAYASAIKTKDPAAQVMGFSPWGWCDYFTSAADVTPANCVSGPDRAAHGGLPLVEWYLKQVADYQAAHGVRLVDWLDVHFYPQNGVALNNDESPATAAARLQSVRDLYDPAYLEGSWIPDPVNLVPRMKGWIAARAPWMKLAITEYNWGGVDNGDGTGDDGVTAAMAQAEVLAVLGREGVDLATRWVAPRENSLVEDAFKLYLDYDGQGSRVAGDSVRATSASVDTVGSYAVRGPGGKLFLLLFNKATSARTAHVTMPSLGGFTGSAALYRFGPARLAAAGTATASGGAFDLSLPARSATLAVATLAGAQATRFHTVAPCRLLDTRYPSGPLGGPLLAAGGQRTFSAAGRCGVPAGAQAVSVNLTVTGPSGAGNLRLFPARTAAPLASTINFQAGQTRANNAILRLSTDGNGAFTVQTDMAAGGVHFLVDVNGYFQ